MQQSVKLLSKYAVNGVLSMSHLKSKNLRMLKYLQSNYEWLSSLLLDQGIEVLNDLGAIRDPESIIQYLKLHYGSSVDLTDLRENRRSIYRVISGIGNPRKLLKGWGFNVSYRNIDTEESLIQKLEECVGEDGSITVPRNNRELYNKVMYQASRKGMTLSEYLISLGF